MGILDEMMSRVKGAVGALTGNKELKRAGKADHVAGKAKDVISSATSKANDAIDAARNNATTKP